MSHVLLALVAGVLVAWVVLVAGLLVARPSVRQLREAVRILPDTFRLLRRLAKDRSLSKAVRVPLWLLFLYLASPIDIVPDFLPVIGHVDDVILVLLVLRWVIRRAGSDAVRHHWPGTGDGLEALCRAAGLPPLG